MCLTVTKTFIDKKNIVKNIFFVPNQIFFISRKNCLKFQVFPGFLAILFKTSRI